MDKNIVIFDFDNTLVNSLKYWYHTTNNLMFKKYGLKPSLELQKQRHGKSNLQIANMFIELTGLDITTQKVFEDWNTFMEGFYTKKIKMLKGAKSYLKGLHAQGKKLVIASATDYDLVMIALKHFELDTLFSEVFTEDKMGVAKIEEGFFPKMLETLNVTANDVLFFEDSVGSITNATNLNIETVGVVHTYNKHRRDKLNKMCKLVIKNYADKRLKKL